MLCQRYAMLSRRFLYISYTDINVILSWLNTFPTESTLSRDRDSDDDWEEKEASRTISVKFTEDVPEAKEVSLCCCLFLSKRKVYRNASRTFYGRNYCHDINIKTRNRCRKARYWLRDNVYTLFSRQRAYSALSSILVALE